MSDLREAYAALSSSSPRTEVSAVLQSLSNATPFSLDVADRKQLVQLILDDLSLLTKNNTSKSRLTSNDAAQALLAVKTICKVPAGSEVLATRENLSILLSLSQFFKSNNDASNEALRCIANALLLIEHSRSVILDKDVNGGEAVLELLEKSTTAERIFLASRILFLCTVSLASAEDYIRSLVERKPPGAPGNVIEMITTKLDVLMTALLASDKLAREAMTDLLKATFNLLLYYPRIAEDSTNPPLSPDTEGHREATDNWNERLDGILPPLLKLFNTLPTTFPSPLAAPMTHVIHALIIIPMHGSLRPKWFPPQSNSSSPRPSTPSKSPSPVGSLSPETSAQALRSGSESPSTAPKEGKPGAFDRAMSKLAAGRRSLSRSRSPQPSAAAYDTALRVYDLLDVSLAYYLPSAVEPDDSSVLERCSADASLDDLCSPLALLMTKICIADEASRKRVREKILPDDLDRTKPLEGRADFLGRCLRLLASVHHPRLKDTTGEMLFAICNSDPTELAGYVGYGNVAGFLFNKGVMSAPSRSSSSGGPSLSASGAPINPITGIVQQEISHEPEMTQEEKEREAEKLFVLFDRLERSGAMPPDQNPIRKAVQEGKLG